jgi:hypothetical protein
MNKKYLVAVALLAVLAIAFGVFGTVAPPLAEETVGPVPQQESSSESVGHFTNPPTYDSGWVDITTKTGQYVTLKHGLNTTEVVVDIAGKQSLDPMGGALAWSKTYGGTSADYAYSLVQTGDGGYALAGYTKSYGSGNYDFWLVKTDAAGNMQWSKTYGGMGEDRAYSLVQTGDGGYALAGYTGSFGAGSYDFWLIKTDVEMGLARTGLTNTTIILYRGKTDTYWNYVRVRIWLIKEPTWIYGDINMDGVVDAKDLYILSQNYGKTFSLLSLTGIVAIASIHQIKKRKQNQKQPN